MSPYPKASLCDLGNDQTTDTTPVASTPKVNSSQPSVSQEVSIVEKRSYQWQIIWKNIILFSILHTFALKGLWFIFTKAMWKTIFFTLLFENLSNIGITGGSHRLWCHRSYKAKLPLRIFLMLLQTTAFQKSIYEWVRDHRVHHKFTDTDADPHNSNRGFFYSHIGWLLIRKVKDVSEKKKNIHISDVAADPVVRFQKKYFFQMSVLLCFVLPTLIPWYFWSEDLQVSWYVNIFRYMFSLHSTFLVNSAAHIWGTKPYDKNINPTENKLVSLLTVGEGWHNYHHIFPWDYKAAELGNYSLNITTAFLDFMAWIGQAYDLKTSSAEMVNRKVLRSGDGTWKGLQNNQFPINDDNHHQNSFWGWGDEDMKEEDIQNIKLFNKLK